MAARPSLPCGSKLRMMQKPCSRKKAACACVSGSGQVSLGAGRCRSAGRGESTRGRQVCGGKSGPPYRSGPNPSSCRRTAGDDFGPSLPPPLLQQLSIQPRSSTIAYKKTPLLLSFPHVCPEPVLVK
jgi:hypothetical protein